MESKNPGYWKTYRDEHPEYTRQNRERQRSRNQFLTWNLGLKEYNVKSPKERLRQYREFVDARGGVDTRKGKILDAVPLMESVERFIQRTRFFTRLNRPLVYGESRHS